MPASEQIAEKSFQNMAEQSWIGSEREQYERKMYMRSAYRAANTPRTAWIATARAGGGLRPPPGSSSLPNRSCAASRWKSRSNARALTWKAASARWWEGYFLPQWWTTQCSSSSQSSYHV